MENILTEAGPDPREAVRNWIRKIEKHWDRKLLSVNRYDCTRENSFYIDTREGVPGALRESRLPPVCFGLRETGDKMLFFFLCENRDNQWGGFFEGDGIKNRFGTEGICVPEGICGFLTLGEAVTDGFCQACGDAVKEELRTWTESFEGKESACFTDAHTFTICWSPQRFSIRVDGRKNIWEELVLDQDGFLLRGSGQFGWGQEERTLSFHKGCRKLHRLMGRAEREFAEAKKENV